ncbi:hypothetical protein BJX70DRAFT_402859 [Aspergillus crustosus]
MDTQTCIHFQWFQQIIDNSNSPLGTIQKFIQASAWVAERIPGDRWDSLAPLAGNSKVAMQKYKLFLDAEGLEGAYYSNALVWAVRGGRVAAVKLLLEAGADTESRSGGNSMALGEAFISGNGEVLDLLWRRGFTLDAMVQARREFEDHIREEYRYLE